MYGSDPTHIGHSRGTRCTLNKKADDTATAALLSLRQQHHARFVRISHSYLGVIGGGRRVRPHRHAPILPLPLDDDAGGRGHAHHVLLAGQADTEPPDVVGHLLDLSKGELAELLERFANKTKNEREGTAAGME